MKQHTELAGCHRRQQEAELGTMDISETVWSERRNVTAGRVMSPRVETSFYILVQQHQATCLYDTDVTLNSSPQQASILITLPFSQHSQASVQNTPGKTSFHTETQRYIPKYDTDRQTETH